MLEKKGKYNLAVAGVTGAVGRKMLEILEERNFPVAKLKIFASSRSVGQALSFNGSSLVVKELMENSFEGVDIALFSAGAGVSKKFAPFAVKSGCIVIDNSSAFRMEPMIPLIVPEVNLRDIGENPVIISNPNCSTIQMVMALKPIHDKFKIKRVVVSTYQSVSGSGQKAIDEIKNQTKNFLDGQPITSNVYPHQIAFNCIPHIDSFTNNGYTKEEMKMVEETRKILGDESIRISPTTVRVPVFYSHSESLNVETENSISAEKVKNLLNGLDGIRVVDNLETNEYPLAIDAEGKDEVYVGRIRDDISCDNAINFWLVSDNLRKGAALNAIQIAECLTIRAGAS
jgi:aspartate-semialdehyde dehydrogenase